jgi:hypothetical protein
VHLLEEAGDRIGAVLQLSIVRRGLVDVRVEEASAQRHVIQPRREIRFDERGDLVEIEQAQIRVAPT